jgi:hypothetical protein
MFGYPSAYLGWVAFHAQTMAQAKISLTSSLSLTELSMQILKGKMDADRSFKLLGNIADDDLSLLRPDP